LGIDTNHLEMDNGNIITSCTEFMYLGPYLPKMERDTKNIRHRVTQARKIVGALNGAWWSKDITKTPKKLSIKAWL
jgi:hypothetical protein